MADPATGAVDIETVRLLRRASEALIVVLGLAISYVAYRAYRRHRSRPMLFVAAGFVLTLFVPGVLAGVLFFLLDVPAPVVNGVNQISEIAGLGLILYGLWTPRRE
ncbi:DUF7521 family protein [Halorubrum sodomense]|uniref:Uncharacterized protein n=1 Tax=Halorubrum sodomense TaxID=35743 RepID=A0A1I6FK81_HALSD|nr:hypothetical protein [Halorubrum sodomense]SFR30359.1 hypothetical protein SAMN04487937_0178 [Halorubrum sodomense]